METIDNIIKIAEAKTLQRLASEGNLFLYISSGLTFGGNSMKVTIVHEDGGFEAERERETFSSRIHKHVFYDSNEGKVYVGKDTVPYITYQRERD